MRFLSIPLWFGRLIFKRTEDRLFSEQYGPTPNICIGPLCIVWRRYRYIPVIAPREGTRE